MKPRFISKVFCPERRTKTESNEEQQSNQVEVLFPEVVVELKGNQDWKKKEGFSRKRQSQEKEQSRDRMKLPKIVINGCERLKTEEEEPSAFCQPDNEFLDPSLLNQPETPQKVPNQRPLQFFERLNSFRKNIRSETKRKRQRSPNPIVLQSPIFSRSPFFMKICRNKALSVNQRNNQSQFEVTFFPSNKPSSSQSEKKPKVFGKIDDLQSANS